MLICINTTSILLGITISINNSMNNSIITICSIILLLLINILLHILIYTMEYILQGIFNLYVASMYEIRVLTGWMGNINCVFAVYLRRICWSNIVQLSRNIRDFRHLSTYKPLSTLTLYLPIGHA